MERGLEFHAQTKFKETTFMGRSSFHIMQNDEVEKAVHIPLKQSINQIKRKGHRNCTYRVHAPYVQQYFCNLSSCSSLYIYIYIEPASGLTVPCTFTRASKLLITNRIGFS